MAVAERIEVADAPERERYELSINGEVVGFTAYSARPGLIAFVHTEVDERLQGRGLADRLIRFALEDARTRGLAVLPFCPFVKASSNVIGSSRRWCPTPIESSSACEVLQGRAHRGDLRHGAMPSRRRMRARHAGCLRYSEASVDCS
jgi:uncharacterized protein